MKLFVIEARDKADHLAVRMETREAHLAFLNSLGDDLVAAGPFLDENEKPNGSLVIFKAESLEAAQAFAARDPYVAAGLFASSHVRAWTWALNKPAEL